MPPRNSSQHLARIAVPLPSAMVLRERPAVFYQPDQLLITQITRQSRPLALWQEDLLTDLMNSAVLHWPTLTTAIASWIYADATTPPVAFRNAAPPEQSWLKRRLTDYLTVKVTV